MFIISIEIYDVGGEEVCTCALPERHSQTAETRIDAYGWHSGTVTDDGDP